jgi:hypothetical protein
MSDTPRKKPTPKIEIKNEKGNSTFKRSDVTKHDVRPLEGFEEGLQRILEKFEFPEESRREIFSRIKEYTAAQQAGKPKKDNQNDQD